MQKGGDFCGEGQSEGETESQTKGQSGTQEAGQMRCEDEVRKEVQELRRGPLEVLQAAQEEVIVPL
jgi:hypothetical protein